MRYVGELIGLPFWLVFYVSRATLLKNKAEQRHCQQRSCSFRHGSNRPRKPTMVLHGCMFRVIVSSLVIKWFCEWYWLLFCISFFYNVAAINLYCGILRAVSLEWSKMVPWLCSEDTEQFVAAFFLIDTRRFFRDEWHNGKHGLAFGLSKSGLALKLRFQILAACSLYNRVTSHQYARFEAILHFLSMSMFR